MGTFLRDLRHAGRALAARPAFTLAAVASLAIGIGATTAIFSVVYGVLLRPLPFPGEERLIDVAERNANGHASRMADANFLDLRDRNRTLDGIAAYSSGAAAVVTPNEALRSDVATVSAGFFRVLGVGPALGRGFAADELAPGGAPAALVSDEFWRVHLGASRDPGSISLRIDDVPHTVVGVLPPGFHFPAGAQVWVARERFPWLPSRTAHNDQIVGRRKAGIPLATARADLSAIAKSLAAEHGRDIDMADVAVTPLREKIAGNIRPALLLLLGAAGALFLVGCVDVVALLLARAASRRREIAVRRALGAGRLDLVRTFLAEALGVSIPGGILGVAVAAALVRAVSRFAPPGLPRVSEISVDAPALAAALVLSVFAAGALAVATAWNEYGSRLADVLRGHPATADARARRAHRALSIGQLAITTALLAGVSLLGRSLAKLLDVPFGFQPARVLTMDLDVPAAGFQYILPPGQRPPRTSKIERVLERIGRLPGVEQVGATDALPIGTDAPDGTFLLLKPGEAVDGLPAYERLAHDRTRTGTADFALATGGYFPSMGIPLRRGRLFDARDNWDAPHVAVISESLARSRFAGRDPLGETIEFGNMDGDLRLMTIVGVVGDVHESRIENPPEPIVYGNLLQRSKGSTVTVTMRSAGDPAALAAAARKAAREVDPSVPATVRTMDEVISEAVAPRRTGLVLLSLFGLAALALACTGLAGITAYSIAQRQREMGIRAALGARPAGLLRLLVSEQLRLVAAGALAGTALAAALGGLARAILFGVESSDAVSLAASATALAGAALVAILLPSLRLLRLPAAEVLRAE